MTREEWHRYVESVGLTDNQLGRIISDFERLAVRDRAERLAITAALAEVDRLGSTCELTEGQAGRVVRALQHCRSRADLPAIADLGQAADETVAETVVTVAPEFGQAASCRVTSWAAATAALAEAVWLMEHPSLVLSSAKASGLAL